MGRLLGFRRLPSSCERVCAGVGERRRHDCSAPHIAILALPPPTPLLCLLSLLQHINIIIMASTKLLQSAGIIALLAAPAHYQMGAGELAPALVGSGIAGATALGGWMQGCFMYAVFGLNYIRLSQTAALTSIDRATLLLQAAMHLYTFMGLTQMPPRALSATLLALVGSGLALRD